MMILPLLLPCMRFRLWLYMKLYLEPSKWQVSVEGIWQTDLLYLQSLYLCSSWECHSLLELASQFSCRIPKLSSPQLRRGNWEVDRNRLFWSCTGNLKTNSYIKSTILVSYLQCVRKEKNKAQNVSKCKYAHVWIPLVIKY